MPDALLFEASAGPLELFAQRAAFLRDHGLLLIADAHLGKAQSFRRLGMPVPAGTTAGNLDRLSALIERTRPREVVFLGDMLHARSGRTRGVETAVEQWRESHRLPMRLVRGNHDLHAGDPPPRWNVDVCDEPYRCGAWALCHHPQHLPGAFVLAGHVHPAVSWGQRFERLTLPCFHFQSGLGVLPAFGEFTGLHRVQPGPGDQVAVLAGGELRWLPSSG